jgi:HEAT repeat
VPKSLQYEETWAMSRGIAETVLQGSDATAICGTLVNVALHDPDWAWVQEHCLRLLAAADPEVRGVAATCLGHLARIHGTLDLNRVEPRLRELRKDPEVRGRAEDALDDIQRFMGTDG